MLKLAYFLRKMQTSQLNNSKFIKIKIAKFSRYDFETDLNI